MDKLKLRKMDEDVFDAIVFEGDPVVYKFAQGYENFIRTLAKEFPGEEETLRTFCKVSRKYVTNFRSII